MRHLIPQQNLLPKEHYMRRIRAQDPKWESGTFWYILYTYSHVGDNIKLFFSLERIILKLLKPSLKTQYPAYLELKKWPHICRQALQADPMMRVEEVCGWLSSILNLLLYISQRGTDCILRFPFPEALLRQVGCLLTAVHMQGWQPYFSPSINSHAHASSEKVLNYCWLFPHSFSTFSLDSQYYSFLLIAPVWPPPPNSLILRQCYIWIFRNNINKKRRYTWLVFKF